MTGSDARPPAADVDVRVLAVGDELEAIDGLYRATFGPAVTESGMNPRLLRAIAANGGRIVGAFAAGRLVGYGLALPGRDPADGAAYHYRQTVAVSADVRGSGVGRAIMQEHRRVALADGLTTMRWAYDPVQARNAHLYLDVLGATAVALVRDFYGRAVPGAHGGERTDRCLVHWDLSSAPRPGTTAVTTGLPVLAVGDAAAGGTLLGVPADWASWRETARPAAAAAARDAVVGRFQDALGAGLVAVSCVRTGATSATYRFAAPVTARA